MTLFWSSRNPGLIFCDKHPLDDEGKLSKADIKFFEDAGDPAKCELCGATA